eukprot:CAMPEP_0113244596 /NCGR_PEP_ID=MMETSP0008_2-20120614/8487_1 /TAXON_ID=97485 /ORGANISM="Prymnesium parvum" /LENGTH=271 /DNA_ID=CAMNT_0000092227 /DNA_START=206 /DNA_END=1018 /DNA_ORIENTATION=+ /assembly_acc=CAM_ASM_000153
MRLSGTFEAAGGQVAHAVQLCLEKACAVVSLTSRSVAHANSHTLVELRLTARNLVWSSAVHALSTPSPESVELRRRSRRLGCRLGWWRVGRRVNVRLLRVGVALLALRQKPPAHRVEEGAGLTARRRGARRRLGHRLDRAGVRDGAMLQMEHVRRPVVEPVEDVRRVDDSRAPLLALLAEEVEQRRDDVQVGRHLVHQQQVGGAEQLEEQLRAAALAVGDLVESPRQVHVEQRDEAVHPRGDELAAHPVAHQRLHEGRRHVLDREVGLEGD